MNNLLATYYHLCSHLNLCTKAFSAEDCLHNMNSNINIMLQPHSYYMLYILKLEKCKTCY